MYLYILRLYTYLPILPATDKNLTNFFNLIRVLCNNKICINRLTNVTKCICNANAGYKNIKNTSKAKTDVVTLTLYPKVVKHFLWGIL